ncbi:hypothetical protein ACW9HR_38390 [Nocardia gipuzkoensis]
MRDGLYEPWTTGVRLTPFQDNLWGFDIECILYLSPTVKSISFENSVEVRFDCADCGKAGRTVFVRGSMEESFCTSKLVKTHSFRGYISGITVAERESTGRSIVAVNYQIRFKRNAIKGVRRRNGPRLPGGQWLRVSMNLTCLCGEQYATGIQTNTGRPFVKKCSCGEPLYYNVYDSPIPRSSGSAIIGDAISRSDITLTKWEAPSGEALKQFENIADATLVHGTWPRGLPLRIPSMRRSSSLWFEPSSAFVSRLEAALKLARVNVRFSRTEWSGSNSLRAREWAARELAEHLIRQRTKCCTTQVVIAHSHGGNVALRAIQLLDELGAKCHDIAVVTISTPFISIRANRFLGYQGSVGLSLLSATLVTELSKYLTINVSIWWLHLIIWAIEVALVLLLLVAAESSLFGPHAAEPETHWRLEKYISFYRHPVTRNVKLLAIRGANDEAALVIASAATGERLTRSVSYLATRIATFTAMRGLPSVGIIVAMAIGSAIAAADRPVVSEEFVSPGLLSSLWQITLSMIVILYVLHFFSAVLSGLFRSAFGKELFHSSFSLEVSAESAPDSTNCATVVTFPDPDARADLFHFPDSTEARASENARMRDARRMRHSLYKYPEVVETIADWIVGIHEERAQSNRDDDHVQ